MNHTIAYLVGGVWLVLALVGWIAAVPTVLSTSTFLWANVATLSVVIALPALLRAGQPSRSMAAILYDTEHPDDRSGR